MTDKVAKERDVVRTHRFPDQEHMGFIGRPVTFLVIAGDAGTHEVFPRIFSAACSRDDVIDCKRRVVVPAVLTAMSVTTQNIFPGKDDLLVGYSYVDREAYDAREGQ